MVTALAAVALFFVWRLWQSEGAMVPPPPDLARWSFKYTCEAGHSWTAPGQVEPRTCPTCGKPAHPVVLFLCQQHGTFEVAARFATGPDGVARASELRLPGHDWVPADKGVTCPRCGRKLVRQREDPLAGKKPGRSKGRG